MATPTKQSSVVTNPGGTGSSIVPTLPTHAANDEIEIWVTKTGNVAWSAPAGWTIRHQVSSPGSASTATQGTLLYRRVLSTDTLPLPSPTCNLGATVTRHAIARTIRGADIEGVYTTPSWSATATGSGTANPIRPASVTTPAPEMLVTHYYCQRLATNAPEPTGYTQDQEVITSGTLVTNVSEKNVADQNTALTNQDASPTSGGRWAAVITCAPSIDYPYYRSGSQATATATSVTPALPPGTTATDQRGNKDLVIATVEAAGTTPSPNTPGDWTEISAWPTTTFGGATTVRKYAALYDGSLDRQFNRTGTGEISVCLTTYYNAHQTVPIGSTDAIQRASATSSAWDGLDRAEVRCVVTASCVADGTPSYTTPAGWIERMDGLGIVCADQTFNAIGTTPSGSFTLSTASPTLVGLVEIRNLTAPSNVAVIPATLSLTITAFAPALSLNVIPSVSGLTLSTFAPRLSATFVPISAALTINGFAPSLELKTTPVTQSLTLTTFEPIVDVGGQETFVVPATASLVMTNFVPALDLSITPGVVTLSLSEFVPALELKTIPPTTALNVSTFSVGIRLDVTPSMVSLTLNTLTPVLGVGIVPDAVDLTLNSFTPAVTTAVIPSAVILVTDTFGPSINLTLIPQTAGLSLSSFPPALSLSLIPQATGLTLTAFAPALGGETTIVPESATLNLTGFPAQLSEIVTPNNATFTLTEFAPQLVSQIIPLPETLTITSFATLIHSAIIVQSLSLAIASFAPNVTTGGGQAVFVTPSTKQFFLNTQAANVLAFHVRSELSVGREIQTVRVAKENRVLNVS